MRVESALAFLAADDYHQWIEIGLALKASLGEAGFALWDRWSMRSGKYPGTDATAKRWATFQPTGISVGTVFELAKRAGWTPPRQARRKAPDAAVTAPRPGRGRGAEPERAERGCAAACR
jgi:putative DNA primase/helicase